MQDDVFDQHIESRAPVFISDQFLFEAERTLEKYFDRGSPFWNIYRRCLQNTTRAILITDRLQQSPKVHPKTLAAAYVRVNALFQIGAAAVCSRYHRMRDFDRIQTFADNVSLGWQILDDFQDIEEDLERKRYNYAANVILCAAGVGGKTHRRLIDQIGYTLLISSAGENLLTEVELRFERGFRALEHLALPAIGKCLRAYIRMIRNMQEGLHRRRVRRIFG